MAYPPSYAPPATGPPPAYPGAPFGPQPPGRQGGFGQPPPPPGMQGGFGQPPPPPGMPGSFNSQQPGYAGGFSQQTNVVNYGMGRRRPPDYMVFSCLTMWCFNFLFGCIAVFFSYMSTEAAKRGEMEKAEGYGKNALYTNIAGIVATVFLFFILPIIMVAIFASNLELGTTEDPSTESWLWCAYEVCEGMCCEQSELCCFDNNEYSCC